MPRLQYVDPFGTPFEICSSNPELIAQWLGEILHLAPPSGPAFQCQIRAYPMFLPDGTPDWPPNAAHTFMYTTTDYVKAAEQVRRIAAAMHAYADEEEKHG